MKTPRQSPPVMPYEQRAASSLYATCRQCGASWLVLRLPANGAVVAESADRSCPKCNGFAESIEIKAV